MKRCEAGGSLPGKGHRCAICEQLSRHAGLAAHCRVRDWTLLPSKHSRVAFAVECDRGHPFHIPTTPSLAYPRDCPVCAGNFRSNYKTEAMVARYLHESTEVSFVAQQTVVWTEQAFRFDFCFPQLMIVLELDGPQHFTAVEKWHSQPDDVRDADVRKMYAALHNGYTVLRLAQTEVWTESFNWRAMLSANLHRRDEPTVRLLTPDPTRYGAHMSDLQRLLAQD